MAEVVHGEVVRSHADNRRRHELVQRHAPDVVTVAAAAEEMRLAPVGVALVVDVAVESELVAHRVQGGLR